MQMPDLDFLGENKTPVIVGGVALVALLAIVQTARGSSSEQKTQTATLIPAEGASWSQIMERRNTGVIGSVGPGELVRGDSAYELAQKAGFKGTLEEWLASLKGNPGSAAGVATATLSPKPIIKPGDTVAVNVKGFRPNEPVVIRLDGVGMGTFNAGSDGSGSKGITIPSTTTNGLHSIQIIGNQSPSFTREITVTAPQNQPKPTQPTQPAPKPNTPTPKPTKRPREITPGADWPYTCPAPYYMGTESNGSGNHVCIHPDTGREIQVQYKGRGGQVMPRGGRGFLPVPAPIRSRNSIIVQAGDTFRSLATRAYGSGEYANLLMNRNPGIRELRVGMKLDT